MSNFWKSYQDIKAKHTQDSSYPMQTVSSSRVYIDYLDNITNIETKTGCAE